MYNIDLLILLAALVANLLLGLLVISRDSKSATNRLFFGLMAAISIWSFVNYLSSKNIDTLFYARLVLCFAVLFATFFFLFVLTFPMRQLTISNKKLLLIAVVSTLAIAVTLSPLAFKAINVTAGSQLGNPIVGPGVGLFALTVGFYDIGGLVILANKTRQAEAKERARRLYLLIGMALMLITIIILDFILPVAFSNTRFIPFAPMFIFPFVAFMAYAIIRHKLFDIKRAVARSVAYLLSLGFIGLVYGTIIFSVSSLLADNNQFNSTERIFYIFMALVSAIIFTPTKRFFDRLTNRIFYRDAYDPEQFLNELNTTVVENIELGILLRHTTRVIQENIKSRFCYVEIKATPTTQERLLGTGELELSQQDNDLLKRELLKTGKKTIVTDELGSDSKNLREMLSRNNIGLLVRLLPGNDMYKEAMYYLMLGDKKSGNIYDKQDVRIMEIVADEMLIAIQNSIRFEEIEQFNVTLQQKVNDATVKLQRTNKKLRELDETKDEFISMASHQLRTPLTSVKGYMSMVMEGDAGKLTKQQESLLTQAFVSSQRMVYLIADLLNVSRLKTGKFIIDAQPTNLADVVEGEISQLTETAKVKKIAMKYNKPKKFPELMLDETKVRQVIMNFADNAIYYTPSGGHIDIEVKEDEGSVYFTVKDDGFGVPKEDQKHLFTKFYRATNARKARPDGTGLGLFMAKKVVDAQGGTILFESHEGKGSLFGFSFSKKKLEVNSSSK